MTTVALSPDDVLADITRRLSALGDGRNCKSDNEREAYHLAFNSLDRRRIDIRDTGTELAVLPPKIKEVEQWLAHLRAWRKEWVAELEALPEEKTSEQNLQALCLQKSIDQVDNGVQCVGYAPMLAGLLRVKLEAAYAPTWDGPRDPWTGRPGEIPAAEAKLAGLTKERDILQSRLDAALREPEPVTT